MRIKELIRYTADAYFKYRQYPISITTLQKILYKYKKEIPQNDSLHKHLQFYWYEQGPFSELISKYKDELLQDGILHPKNQGFVTQTPRLFNHASELHDGNLPFTEIRDDLLDIIREDTSVNSATIMEDVYSEDAPYEFYITFKNKFRASLHNYSFDQSTPIKYEQLLSLLHESIGGLPDVPMFSNFKFAFMDFIELIDALEKNHHLKEHGNLIYDVSYEIFKTFAKGVRIIHHDVYYNDKMESWEKSFLEEQKKIEFKIIELYDFVKNLGIKDIHFGSHSELTEHILQLRKNDELAMVSFLPPINDKSINYGSIDAALFNGKSDEELKNMLQECQSAKRAIIHKYNKSDLNTLKYKIMA